MDIISLHTFVYTSTHFYPDRTLGIKVNLGGKFTFYVHSTQLSIDMNSEEDIIMYQAIKKLR